MMNISHLYQPPRTSAHAHCSAAGETYFINLRFLLIICVVIGNMLEPLIHHSDVAHGIFLWIFSFHMPLFVLVTGYFARSNLYGRTGLKILRTIGLQYILFQSIYSLLDFTVFRVHGITHSFFAPYLLLWFLAGHILWRLMMIMMRQLTFAQQLTLSVVLGLLVGSLPVDGVWLALSRTLIYFPFFIIGYHFRFERFTAWFRNYRQLLAAGLSIILLAGFVLAEWQLNTGWFYGNQTFIQLGVDLWQGLAGRLGMYVLQLIASLAFLAFVPWRSHYITELGRRTLYVFLLHGLLVRTMEASGIFGHISSTTGVMLMIVLAILITLLLAQPAVRHWTHYWVEPELPRYVRLKFRHAQRRYSFLR
ncbi:acyltransferase family protein [Paenibacillus shenyangensis]|uniref:acyltransferase family protein n=1 Tax=Paenibacillus sp. A9 TaxID=1284352 RepID=UPI001EE6EB39|nr:fucose 4-O-acetylase [Paenibacillus sp. A9]